MQQLQIIRLLWSNVGLLQIGQRWPAEELCLHQHGRITITVSETLQPLRSASFSGGTCISGQTVLGAAQQVDVQQCLIPVLTAYGDAAAASTAPAEGPAVPQAGQSLPDIHRQVDALVAQDGEQSTDRCLWLTPAGLTCVLCDELHQPGLAQNHQLT